jgi:translation initiation factor 2B subunit (eIF-2B alpha/beta/delta family)
MSEMIETDLALEFTHAWEHLNAKFETDEPFPRSVVEKAEQIKHFMLPENRKYQGALGNAYGMVDAVLEYSQNAEVVNGAKYYENINSIFDFLLRVRLTSQVPLNTVFFIMQKLKKLEPETADIDMLKSTLEKECKFHLQNYTVAREKIAKHMAVRIIDRCEEYGQSNIVIGTHCHSGAVVKAIINAKEYVKNVVVSKTEPEQQGVITAKELCDAGVKVKFIALEQYGTEFRHVNMFLFGIDAVSVEGIVLNKSGTRLIATLAHTKELPVYFLGETYKYARNTLLGGLVRVERRDVTNHLLFNHVGIDLHQYYMDGMLDAQFAAFDTTKPEYYTSIVSEQGFLPMREAFEREWAAYL